MKSNQDIKIIGDCVARNWLPINTPDGTFLHNIHNNTQRPLSKNQVRAAIGLPNDDIVLVLDVPENNTTALALAKTNENYAIDAEKKAELAGNYQYSETSPDGSKILFTQLIDAKTSKTEHVLLDAKEFKLVDNFTLTGLLKDYSCTLLSSAFIGQIYSRTIEFYPIGAFLYGNYDNISINIVFDNIIDTTQRVAFSPNDNRIAAYTINDNEDTKEKKYYLEVYQFNIGHYSVVFKVETDKPRHAPVWLDDNSLVFIGKNDAVYRVNDRFVSELIEEKHVERLVKVPGGLVIQTTTADSLRVMHYPCQSPLLTTLKSELPAIPDAAHQIIQDYTVANHSRDLSFATFRLFEGRPSYKRAVKNNIRDSLVVASRFIPGLGSLHFLTKREKQDKNMHDVKEQLCERIAKKHDDETYAQCVTTVLRKLNVDEEKCHNELKVFLDGIRRLDEIGVEEEPNLCLRY